MKVRNILGNVHSGTLGKKETAVVRKGQQFLRKYVLPHDPKTPKQMRQRKKYAKANEVWRRMPESEKEAYDNRAGNMNMGMSGYNLFVSEFTRGKV